MANKLYEESAIINIANAIREKNGSSDAYKIGEMADAIKNIPTGSSKSQWAMLEETEAKTFTMKDGTTLNVSCTPNIRILDKNFVSWSIEEWHEKAIENNFDSSLRAEPIGFDFLNCAGHHIYWYFKCKGTEATTSAKTYYDTSGKASVTAGTITHSWCDYSLITGATSITDSNSTTAKSVVDGDEIILSTTNSPTTWRITKNCRQGIGSFAWYDNAVDYYNAMLAQIEWLRHRAAIDSGLETTEADGTIGTVTIVTEDDGEMYFYVNGTKTTCLAKYNVHKCFTSQNLTSTMADTIYSNQKTNGTTMNNSCINGDTKPVVVEGSKGAEAYAFNGKWMITTPILSRCTGTTYSYQYYYPDAPTISYAKYLRQLYNRDDIICLDAKTALYYFVNRDYAIASYITYLQSSKGEAWSTAIVPAKHNANIWSSQRYSTTNAWFVNGTNGNINNLNVYYYNRAVGVSVLS